MNSNTHLLTRRYGMVALIISVMTFSSEAQAYPPYHSLWSGSDPAALETVGRQGEMECAAWAVTAAMATNVMRNFYTVNSDSAPSIDALSARGYRMLNADHFFRVGGGNRQTGWTLNAALTKATQMTIPFNHNPAYGVRISVGGFKKLTKVDDMRKDISLDRPVLARMEILPGFTGSDYIFDKPGRARDQGHFVLMVGYNTDEGTRRNASGGAFWECQNSWGAQWGTGGFFRIRPGVAGIHEWVYVVNNTYICDMAGKRLSQTQANKVIEDAINNASGKIKNAVHTNVSYSQLNGSRLPDGDKVSVAASPPAAGVKTDKVTVKLVLPKGMWWKGVLLYDKDKSSAAVGVQGEGGNNGLSKTYTFSHKDLLKKDLVLSKAKGFGVHTNMYRIKDALTRMHPGRTYTIRWVTD